MEFFVASEGEIGVDQANALVRVLKETDRKMLVHMFMRGEIPMGFTNSLKWVKCHQVLSSLPSKKIELENEAINLHKSIREDQDIIKEIELEENALAKRKAAHIARVESFHQLIAQKKKVHDAISSIGHIHPIIEITEMLQEIEKELANSIQAQIVSSPVDFASLQEASKHPKLSLVFNAVGLSSEVIIQLAGVDGCTFTNMNALNGILEYHKFDNLVFKKDLNYLSHMMLHHQLPFSAHEEECPVCFCKTPKDLLFLLEEHQMYLADGEALEKTQMNGKRVLFLDNNDLKHLLPLEDIPQALVTISRLTRIHRDALQAQENVEPPNIVKPWEYPEAVPLTHPNSNFLQDEAHSGINLRSVAKRRKKKRNLE